MKARVRVTIIAADPPPVGPVRLAQMLECIACNLKTDGDHESGYCLNNEEPLASYIIDREDG